MARGTAGCRCARASRVTQRQIFENKGEAMGCSNPHPHCQVPPSRPMRRCPHVMCDRRRCGRASISRHSPRRRSRSAHPRVTFRTARSGRTTRATAARCWWTMRSWRRRSKRALLFARRTGWRSCRTGIPRAPRVTGRALWPYETMLLPRRPVLRLPDLTDAERDGAAADRAHVQTLRQS